MNGKDKIVNSYLKRAKEVLEIKGELNSVSQDETKLGIIALIVEVAKMIQLEERQ